MTQPTVSKHWGRVVSSFSEMLREISRRCHANLLTNYVHQQTEFNQIERINEACVKSISAVLYTGCLLLTYSFLQRISDTVVHFTCCLLSCRPNTYTWLLQLLSILSSVHRHTSLWWTMDYCNCCQSCPVSTDTQVCGEQWTTATAVNRVQCPQTHKSVVNNGLLQLLSILSSVHRHTSLWWTMLQGNHWWVTDGLCTSTKAVIRISAKRLIQADFLNYCCTAVSQPNEASALRPDWSTQRPLDGATRAANSRHMVWSRVTCSLQTSSKMAFQFHNHRLTALYHHLCIFMPDWDINLNTNMT